MKKKQLVVFDVDHTLFCCNLSFLFGKFLYKRGELSFFKALLLIAAYGLHKLHLLSVFRLHQVAFFLLFQGKRVVLFQALAEQFIEDLGERFQHQQIVELLYAAQKNNEYVWLLSSSPHFLVCEVAKKWGVDSFKGTTYQQDKNGLFKQVDQVLDGKSKWQALQNFLSKTGILSSQVRVYTDSIVDLELLTHVGEPVAVFPDKKLAKVARQNRWKIIQ